MYYFIVNPNAGSRKGIRFWREMKEYLLKESIDFCELLTRGEGDAQKFAVQITNRHRPDVIVVVGGDGTLHETVSGMKKGTEAKLAFIPAGSGNDFARGIGYSSDPMERVRAIVSGRSSRPLDVGNLCAKDGSSGSFLVSSGVGYDARVCHMVNHAKSKKFLNRIRLGKLTYLEIGLRGLLSAKLFSMRLVLDGSREEVFHDVLFASIHNLPYEGGGLKFSPDAVPDDGFLDLCIVAGIPKRKMPSLLTKVPAGKHIGCPGVYSFRCRRAEFYMEEPQYYHMDGEVPGQSCHVTAAVTVHGLELLG
ncbi:diacylglycerol/lipid kinase family protein [Anaerostipes sp.]|uniref:diacylglycerol/lipid kinase family protein n=1 Tax=Anaerostipes sp. TaxID=1872530 RepID=UPI0025BFC337|nr:diacylglycerol kinase family protein [Anaerostipes sp.]MBS7007684.1 diacylglycerol kinase family lipid kinase [Anaerostipes sp.]